MQTHIPRHPAGSESRAAVDTGEGTVGIGGGVAEKTIIHCIKLVNLQSLLQS